MKRHCYFIFLIETLLLLLFTIKCASAYAVGQADSENNVLYKASDPVVILNAKNFKSYVYNSNFSWLVEFYSSWCGHCINFAPIWKIFAGNVLPWKNVVQVGVIDCADDDNNPTCREFEVMHYPTIRFFHVNSKEGILGLELKKGVDADNMQNILIEQLEKEQQEGRGSSWPNIIPYRKTELESVWKAVTYNVKYIFLIFETPESHVGTSLILDIQGVPALHIRRITSENELLCVTAKVTRFPSLILLERNVAPKSINVKDSTREGIYYLIQKYMTSVGIHIENKSKVFFKQNEESKTIANVTPELQKPEYAETPSLQFRDVVFQNDLDKTLRYSLRHEISLSKQIDGEKMLALKEYLSVLVSYFPKRGNRASYLTSLYDVVKDKKSISGKDFRELVTETEDVFFSVFSESQEWIGCKGSSKIYRGYPCGLWTMFHMLTVNFENQSFHSIDYDSSKVLKAMYGYIKNFFGCAECSKHFVEMANKNKILDVKSEDESILWLWKAHNEVNQRLAGDATEDPQHKKIQYPATDDCPSCRDENNNFIENEVLLYLKKKYKHDGINYQVESDVKQTREKLVSSSAASRKLGWDFNIFDISICVFLYIISASILILVCIKFAFSRSFKKRPYVYSFFGKV